MRTNLNTLQRVTTRNLKELKQLLTADHPKAWQASFTLGGTNYQVLPDIDEGGNVTGKGFVISWTDEGGNDHAQRIGVTFQPCNLRGNKSNVWFLVCPYKRVKCRTLYTDGKKFFSRYALTYGYTYSSQLRTPKQKELYTPTIPNQRYRKTEYKGKQTPFGRRYQKAIEQDERADHARTLDISRLMCRYTKRRWNL